METSVRTRAAGITAAFKLDGDRISESSLVCGAIALVPSRARISSLLVDNLNASVHLRALLTDVFLLEQSLKTQG